MKRTMLLLTLIIFSTPAWAGTFHSIEDRAAALNAKLKGNESYHAELARQLAEIAQEEKEQHDLNAARSFMKMAEDNAAQTEGAK